MTDLIVYDWIKVQALTKRDELLELNKQIADLYRSTFTESENEDEGVSVAQLAESLLSMIEGGNCIGFLAYDNNDLIGAVIFSKLFTESYHGFLLSPMVVKSECQGQGVGQALIEFALKYLKDNHVEIVLTYGDPAFYSKLGFISISDKKIVPPYQLSMPMGWLGQSLTDLDVEEMKFQVSCVQPFSHPELW